VCTGSHPFAPWRYGRWRWGPSAKTSKRNI
jgi:hypothetical protein